MDWYSDYRLIKYEDGYVLEVYLNKNSEEFSSEFISNVKENILKLDDRINKLVDEHFPNFKINTVKLILGTVVVATIPFVGATQVAAATSPTSVQQTVAMNTTGTVTASKLNVRSGPSTDYSIIHLLWYGNHVKVIGESGNWYHIQLSDGRTGWVSKTYLKISTNQQKINTVVATAKSLIGTPYKWGGQTPQDGFDCSGLTVYVYKQVGYQLNRISSEQATQGIYVSQANLQPGDLVFFSMDGDKTVDHVGIYIGNGQMIHSPKTGDTVKTTDITTSYWQSRYITARRIIY